MEDSEVSVDNNVRQIKRVYMNECISSANYSSLPCHGSEMTYKRILNIGKEPEQGP
jgi:hypothetical protein